jgi:predicted HTH transcriptional regulator
MRSSRSTAARLGATSSWPTRAVVGVEKPLDLEERIASLVADSIEPRLLPEIEIVPWRKTQVVVVTVHPSALRPHHVRTEGPARGTSVRLGPTNRAADAALVAELARRIDAAGFDEKPLPDLDSEAIDFAAASQCFAQQRGCAARTSSVGADSDLSHRADRISEPGVEADSEMVGCG